MSPSTATHVGSPTKRDRGHGGPGEHEAHSGSWRRWRPPPRWRCSCLRARACAAVPNADVSGLGAYGAVRRRRLRGLHDLVRLQRQQHSPSCTSRSTSRTAPHRCPCSRRRGMAARVEGAAPSTAHRRSSAVQDRPQRRRRSTSRSRSTRRNGGRRDGHAHGRTGARRAIVVGGNNSHGDAWDIGGRMPPTTSDPDRAVRAGGDGAGGFGNGTLTTTSNLAATASRPSSRPAVRQVRLGRTTPVARLLRVPADRHQRRTAARPRRIRSSSRSSHLPEGAPRPRTCTRATTRPATRRRETYNACAEAQSDDATASPGTRGATTVTLYLEHNGQRRRERLAASERPIRPSSDPRAAR